MQNIEKLDCETSKLQPANLLETSRDTARVCTARTLYIIYNVYNFFLLSQPDPSSVMTD